MKKMIRKISVCILSAMLLHTAVIIPVNAADQGYATFDPVDIFPATLATMSKAYEGANKINGISIKGAGIEWEAVTDTTNRPTNILSVPDPKGLYTADKAFRINRNSVAGASVNEQNIQLWEYKEFKPTAPQTVVFEYDFMYDSGVHGALFSLQNSGFKEYRILESQRKSDGTMTLNGSRSGYSTSIDIAKNEWHHIKIIADFNDTKPTSETDPTPIFDFSKNNITCYVNGQVLVDHAPIGAVWADGTWIKTWMFVNNGASNKTFPEYNLYLDNIRWYQAPQETTFEILSDATQSVYMNGSKIKFYADSLLGTDDGVFINKVEYYLDGATTPTYTSTQFPFVYECQPNVAGKHSIMALAYNENDPTEPIQYDEKNFWIEPGFRETNIMYENFANYVDGTLDWTDANGEGSYKIVNGAESKKVIVDAEHGNSLSLGATNGRFITGYLKDVIYNGTIKVSGEYYLNSPIGNNNSLMTLKNPNSQDINGLLLHNALTLLDRQQSGASVAQFISKKWYKIDWIVDVKDGQCYYTAYVDGKRVTQGGYSETANVKPSQGVKGAVFLASTNTNADNIYIDNLSISYIEYLDNTVFTCADKTVTTLGEMTGTTLTAKTIVACPGDNQQYMAVYDKTTKELLKVVVGTYNADELAYYASSDLAGLENIIVKVFVWDNIAPNWIPALIQ